MIHKESKPFYSSSSWRKVRRLAMMRDGGMCRDCMDRFEDGIGFHPNRAEMVHHIQPIETHPELALDLTNLVSLCNECHARRHPEKGERGNDDGDPRPKIRVIKV